MSRLINKCLCGTGSWRDHFSIFWLKLFIGYVAFQKQLRSDFSCPTNKHVRLKDQQALEVRYS